MGPRRVWATLLLAAVVLQYHGVHAGPTKCKQCTVSAMAEATTCVASQGCVAVVQPFQVEVDSTKDCNKLTCPGGGFFMTSLALADPHEINCDANGKWTEGGVDITEAVCVKKFLCSVKSIRTASCTPAQMTSVSCEEFPFADSGPVSCPGGKTLYYKTAAGAAWSAHRDITCNSNTGVYEMDLSTELAATDLVVCATGDPDTLPLKSCENDNRLVSTCPAKAPADSNCVDTDAPAFSDDAGVVCAGKTPFFKTSAPVWITSATTGIICDRGSGFWKAGSIRLQGGDNVVCATKDPTPSCMATQPLSTTCPIGAPTASNCVPVSSYSDASVSCPIALPNAKLYYEKNPSAWELVPENTITCDRISAEWKEGSSNQATLASTSIACADSDPTPPTINCPTLATDCDPAWINPTIDCAPPNLRSSDPCDAATTLRKLYFKQQDAPSKTFKFMEAQSLACGTDNKWALVFMFGLFPKTDKVLVASDRAICAKSNPDAAVCPYGTVQFDRATYKLQVPQPPIAADPGTKASCAPKHGLISEDGNYLPADTGPVCNEEGAWSYPNGELVFSQKVACVIKLCKTCGPPIKYNSPESGIVEVEVEEGGECDNIGCTQAELKFAMKYSSEALPRYFAGSVVCDADATWKFENGLVVDEISCAQQLPCLNNAYANAKMTCPTTPAITGCVDPTPDATAAGKLTCVSPKKMFIRSDNTQSNPQGYWEEIKAGASDTTITCDTNTAKWTVTIVDKTTTESRDFRHTIICADENPKPEPPPTPPTIEPICTLCKGQLPTFLDCDACSKNGTEGEKDYTLESTNKGEPKNEDKCMLKPANGRKIVINNFQEIKDFIECNRTMSKRNPGQVQWLTRDGEGVAKFSSRKDAPHEEWRTLSYVIVGVAFITIGGMGIGCFVIYFRMRKQPSSREKKKKERGVTKKYTSSNVVKTNQSNRSKEACKSKEPTGSKMDDQFEEAPTLKL